MQDHPSQTSNMEPIETDLLTPIVARVLKIETITRGAPQESYLVRYRGRLYGDSSEAHARLTKDLAPREIMPIFRPAGEEQARKSQAHAPGSGVLQTDAPHEIFLVPALEKQRPSNPLVNLGLFILTLFSVLFAGALHAYAGPEPESGTALLFSLLAALPSGIPFAISLLAILLAHEFGHYLAARYHRTNVTLPYFIPFPLSLFGTMGAFIRLKEPPRNKRVLLDIGIAGPLAGLVIAIPVLLYGLSLSTIEPVQVPSGQGIILEGNSILYLLAKYAVFGQLLPAPQSYGSLPPALYWIRYFFTSQPLPIGGMDVWIHPVAWAGWAGLLVTALNLIPAGQLDGGHVIFVLFGRRARILLPFILGGLVLMGIVWQGWWLWALLIYFLGRVYAEPLDQITGLDPRRKAIAVLGLVIFVLVFTPVPLIQTVVGG
jgi:membrane-associated protease RseP (regulator of RpoE activity)